uniref:CSON008452 protein n=1 Tax=Culicoides sonorensis TaxID=179676 RepID=A0A336LPF5_CULSO
MMHFYDKCWIRNIMTMKVIAVMIIFCSMQVQRSSASDVNMPSYHKMPQLQRAEQFHKCMFETENLAVYCVVRTAIKPDPSSELWQQIESFSNDTKRHYRHDMLTTGLCLTRCELELKALNASILESLEAENDFQINYKYTLDSRLFKDIELYNAQYGELINKCLNLYLMKYNLKGYSTPILCETNKQMNEEKTDYLDVIFLVILGMLVAATAICSYVDRQNNTQGTLNYYKEPVNDKTLKWNLITAFSIARNYYKLIQPGKNEIERDLRVAQGIRLFFLYFIVFSHSTLGYAIEIVVNPEYYERSYHQLLPVLLFNGLTYVQVLFGIAGFMLAVQIMGVAAKMEERFRFYPLAVIYRYLRFFPIYGFLILFNATYLYKLQDAAHWQRVGGVERQYCRQNWWANLLYKTKGFEVSKMCMFHTYFISLEFQLFMFGLACLMIIWRYPKSQKIFTSIITLLSIASAGIFTYIHKLDGILVISPEERRLLTHQSYFQNYMTSIEPNAGPYFIGISLGLLYHPIKESQLFSKIKFKLSYYLWHLLPIFAILSMLSTQLFYEYDFEKPSIWMSFYAMFTQNIWALMAVTGALLFCVKKTSFLTSMFNLQIFLPVYRLTYTTYICHVSVLYVIAGASKGAANLSTPALVLFSTSCFLCSHFLAFILTLLIEYPTIGVINQIFQRLGKRNSRYLDYIELVT